MAVISTKFLQPTTCRGARVKASANGMSVIRPWDFSKSSLENHDGVAWELAEKLCWNDSGRLKLARDGNGDGCCYIVFRGKDSLIPVEVDL